MRFRQVGALSLGIACIGLGTTVLLAITHVIPWSVLEYLWPCLIILFGIELVLHHVIHPAQRLVWNGFAFAALCLLFVASMADLVGVRVVQTFTRGELPWDTHIYTFPVSGELQVEPMVSQLQVRVVNADIHIQGDSENAIRYRGVLSIRAANEKQAYRLLATDWFVHRSGNGIELMLRAPRSDRLNFSTGLTKKGTLTVDIPSRLFVQAETMNGSLQVSRAFSGATTTTYNGSISLEHIGGTARASTLNGGISVMDASQVFVRTTNGNVALRAVRGPGSVRVVNGSIIATLLRSADWTLSTVNGDVRCVLPQHSNHIAVTADGPHVRFVGRRWSLSQTVDQKRTTGRIGTPTHHIQLKTLTGAIVVGLGQPS